MSEDCSKCKVKLKRNEISTQCAGNCMEYFHIACTNITDDVYKVMKNIQNLKWFCDTCITCFNTGVELKTEIHEFKNAVKTELHEFMRKIAGSDTKHENLKTDIKRSYADAAGEVIVIQPKSKQESVKTREAIRKNLNPATLEVGITQVKDTKEGGILIKCKSKEEVEKIKIAAEKKLKRNYHIKTPQQKNPQIKILDIEDEISKEELKDSIIKQNGFFKRDDAFMEVKVIKKMKTRYMGIIECDPFSFQQAITQGKLSIGWAICRIFEYVPVFRCFKCGDFDHKASDCERDEKCLKCGVSDHDTENCKSESFKCANCIIANEKLKLKLDVDHFIFDNNCKCLQRKIEQARRKIKAYSQNE